MTIEQFRTLCANPVINVTGLCRAAKINRRNVEDYIQGRIKSMKPKTHDAIVSVLAQLRNDIDAATINE